MPSSPIRGLVATPDGGTVSAIRFKNGDGRSEILAADLVVEASERGNLTLGILESISQAPPEETAIGVDITYATAVFAIPDDAPTDWKAVATFDSPAEGGLAAIMLPLERDQWIVTVVGRHGEKPPNDRDGFLAYAQRLRTPTICDAIKKAEQLGEIVRFGFPSSFRRHFDRLVEFPHGLLPFGDSLCRVIPMRRAVEVCRNAGPLFPQPAAIGFIVAKQQIGRTIKDQPHRRKMRMESEISASPSRRNTGRSVPRVAGQSYLRPDGEHHDTAILPARPRRPRGKAKLEVAVLIRASCEEPGISGASRASWCV